MDFHSLPYLLFFSSVTVIFFVLPGAWRTLFLLAVSSYFYASYIPEYLSILYLIATIDYFAAHWIERSEGNRRRVALGVSLAANLGLLSLFKYSTFAVENWNGLTPEGLRFDWQNNWALPIGLSFHTFQAMSYTIEVYRRNVQPERSFWTYALYVMFFPQLVAGPIERPQHLLPQLHAHHGPQAERILRGLVQMAQGYFKKVVIADRLGPVVDGVYYHPQALDGMPLLCGTVAFALQIYCDFSGYSDIAIGSARVLGIELMTNFRRPYLAHSVSDFWRRWHISLSTWFRDYVYIPLGGNSVDRMRWARNIMITFLLSGLWHGASWTYVVWGGLNGAFLLLERRLPRLPAPLWCKRAVTFLAILVTWVFFRARTFSDAAYILGNWWHQPLFTLSRALRTHMGLTLYDWHVLGAALVLLFWVESREERSAVSFPEWVVRQPAAKRWTLIYLLLCTLLFWGKMNSSQQFIYFQF